MNTDKHRYKNQTGQPKTIKKILFLSVSICVYLWLIFLSSCSSKPTDVRALVPADSLVYLETNDLAAALQPIIDSKPFTEVAKNKPDLSALKGVQLAVAVTGFETSEEKVNEEQSIGRVQPRFVAIADTHAFHFQAVGFAEQKLGSFVAKIYDSEPTIDKSEKNGGKYFTWTAADGRKAYALVIDSLIYFGNDESAIDKCLATKRGETDSIIKIGKIHPADPQTLASGYVSTDGIAQIANIVGLKFASEASEDSEVQSAIAGIVPQLLRNSITDISWTASNTNEGIEDKYLISMPYQVADVFNEALAPDSSADSELIVHVPANVPSATFYNFRDLQIAWRSAIGIVKKQIDAVPSGFIEQLSPILFASYAIHDPDSFLKVARPKLLALNFSHEGDLPVICAKTGNLISSQRSLVSFQSHFEEPNAHGVLTWFDDQLELAAKFAGDELAVGNDEGVGRAFNSELANSGYNANDINLQKFAQSNAAITTLTHTKTDAIAIVDIISQRKGDRIKSISTSYAETNFTKVGIERRTVSDFGLIGSIIAQLGQD